MKIYFLTLSFLFFFNIPSASQTDVHDTNNFYFHLQRIHLDLTSILFINDISLSSDFEITRIHSQSIGIQAGYSFLTATSFGGEVVGSPFHDINLLGYTTLGEDNFFSVQLFFGYALRLTSQINAGEYPVSGLKYGTNFQLSFNKYIRMHLKGSWFSGSEDFTLSAIGLGLSLSLVK